MNKLKMWFKKNFGILTVNECLDLELYHHRNVYGDDINHLNCRSLWMDYTGKTYRCNSLFNTQFAIRELRIENQEIKKPRTN